MSIQTGLSFGDFLRGLRDEIVTVDAEMQFVQRDGWNKFNEGYPLLAGLDRYANLGITEVTVSFWVEPVQPGFWSRLCRATQHVFGKTLPVAGEVSVAGPLEKMGAAGFEVTVTISRDQNGRLHVKSEPEPSQDVFVSNLSSP